MKALYFDCFSGISGDMTLGALLDMGIDPEVFLAELAKLRVDGYKIEIHKSIRNGITGTNVEVILEGEKCEQESGTHHHHGHEHGGADHHHLHHEQEELHQHEHVHPHSARNLSDIEKLIEASELRSEVKAFSKKVFGEIARAEAKVHGKDISEVHFHEVGAVDSIVDIVGTAICLNLLGVEKVFSSPLHDGHGFIKCQHGVIPVPVPAVMEMLKESKIPYISEDIPTELVTPTGMGIIKCLSSGFGRMPVMEIEKAGYGMGKRDTGGFNALRVVMGTIPEKQSTPELKDIAVLETNIDDMSPELLGFTMEKLMENGALDVFYTPIYMKKNRPAVMLTVLSGLDREDTLVQIILKETTTLGIRRTLSSRYCMERKWIRVETGWGEVGVKVASLGDIIKFAPEYEDCKKIAKQTGMPLKDVFQLAVSRVDRNEL